MTGPTKLGGLLHRAAGWARRQSTRYNLILQSRFTPGRIRTFSFDSSLSILLPAFSDAEIDGARASISKLAPLRERGVAITSRFAVLRMPALTQAALDRARGEGEIVEFADTTSMMSFVAGSSHQVVFPEGAHTDESHALRARLERFHVGFHGSIADGLHEWSAREPRTLTGPVQSTYAVFESLKGNVMSNQYAFTESLDWTIIKELPGKFSTLARSARIHAHPLSIISTSLGRIARQRGVGKLYADYLQGESVLDIGCDLRGVAEFKGSNTRYVGVDMHGDADCVVNVNDEELPFSPRSFETVVCVETLEHAQRVHDVFDKLAEVSRRFLIGSLPVEGAWTQNRLVDELGAPFTAYQVPVAPPFDRHCWLANFSDGLDFIYYRARKAGFRVVRLDLIARASRLRGFNEAAIVRKFGKGDLTFLNRNVLLILFVLERT